MKIDFNIIYVRISRPETEGGLRVFVDEKRILLADEEQVENGTPTDL